MNRKTNDEAIARERKHAGEAPGKIVVGLDPGGSGGIAWMKPGVGIVAVKMPEDFAGIAALAWEMDNAARQAAPNGVIALPVVVYVEQVSGFVKPTRAEDVEECPDCEGRGRVFKMSIGDVICRKCDGSGRISRENRQPGHAMFTFGRNTGAAIMAFTMIGAEIRETPAKTWQAPLFIRKGKREKTEWKNELKALAQRFFPGLKVTLAKADALLILRFGMQREGLGAVIVPGNPQRPQGGAPARKAAPRSVIDYQGSAVVGADADAGHFVGDWKGIPFVFRRAKNPTGPALEWVIVRKATIDDMRLLPIKPA